MPDLSPDLMDEIRETGESLIRKFTPPEYIPGCTVLDITDKDQYDTDNGWIECRVSQHNQQRCRWRGQYNDVAVDDIVDVLYFKSYLLFVVYGQGGAGTVKAAGRETVNAICGGRLTGQTGVAVSDSAGSISTLYFTPYESSTSCGQIGLYTGTAWETLSFSEISLALSGLTSGNNYDIYVYNNSGTLAIDTPVVWTNDTTPASRTTQDGIYVQSGATTRRLVGTIRATAATTTEDTTTLRFISNLYNRVERHFLRRETADSWTYASVTWRSFNNNTANRFQFVHCVAGINTYVEARTNLTSTLTNGYVGIGLDSTAATSAYLAIGGGTADNSELLSAFATYNRHSGIGYHFLQMIERCETANTVTFYGDNATSNLMRCGMVGYTWG